LKAGVGEGALLMWAESERCVCVGGGLLGMGAGGAVREACGEAGLELEFERWGAPSGEAGRLLTPPRADGAVSGRLRLTSPLLLRRSALARTGPLERKAPMPRALEPMGGPWFPVATRTLPRDKPTKEEPVDTGACPRPVAAGELFRLLPRLG